VKRLQRDILPGGISSRTEAELLLRLDHSVRRADPSFSAWLVIVMIDFVVWGIRPTGYVDQETAEWLAGVLESRRGPTRTALGLADEIVREAQNIDEALLSWMRTNSRKGPRRGLEMMSFKALTAYPKLKPGFLTLANAPGQAVRSRRGSRAQDCQSSLAHLARAEARRWRGPPHGLVLQFRLD